MLVVFQEFYTNPIYIFSGLFVSTTQVLPDNADACQSCASLRPAHSNCCLSSRHSATNATNNITNLTARVLSRSRSSNRVEQRKVAKPQSVYLSGADSPYAVARGGSGSAIRVAAQQLGLWILPNVRDELIGMSQRLGVCLPAEEYPADICRYDCFSGKPIAR